MESFDLTVITPFETIFSGKAYSIQTINENDTKLEIRFGHAPGIYQIKQELSFFSLENNCGEYFFKISTGLVKVQVDTVLIEIENINRIG